MSDSDQFARLLRGWRTRTPPHPDSSRPQRRQRRTPGLRREELALAAGVSADYVTQLEQGRAHRPSASVVAALAHALGLAPDEVHAFHVAAGLAGPTSVIDRELDDRVRRLLQRSVKVAMAAYSADWWLLGWNPLWAELLGDPARFHGYDTNLVWQVFTSDDWRPIPHDRTLEKLKQSLADDLRSATIDYPDDPRLQDLVAVLTREAPQFPPAWDRALAGRHPAERKTLRHPDAGDLLLDADTFQLHDTHQHLVVYSAQPETVDDQRLAALASAAAPPAEHGAGPERGDWS